MVVLLAQQLIYKVEYLHNSGALCGCNDTPRTSLANTKPIPP